MCDTEKNEQYKLKSGTNEYHRLAQQRYRNRKKIKGNSEELYALDKDELIKIIEKFRHLIS